MRSLLPGFSPSNINASQPQRYHHPPTPPPHTSTLPESLLFEPPSRREGVLAWAPGSLCGVFALFVFSLLQLRTGPLR